MTQEKYNPINPRSTVDYLPNRPRKITSKEAVDQLTLYKEQIYRDLRCPQNPNTTGQTEVLLVTP